MNSQEWMCLWYLRLNGYFTIPNFIAHRRTGTLTEVDILGVRFPHSVEIGDRTQFDDDRHLDIPNDRIDVVFAETKAGHVQQLNGPWNNPHTGALHYVLRRVGIVPEMEIANLATHLYHERKWVGGIYQVRIVVVADSIAEGLQKEGVTYLNWQWVLAFVHERFGRNEKLKAEHESWDKFGQYLWNKLSGGNPPTPTELFDDWKG